jgi:hypothetical protein
MSDVVEVATTTVLVTVASPDAATVLQAVTLTTVDAGIRGPQGVAGPAGADSTVPGPQGPNQVTGTTDTTLSGILIGDGSHVGYTPNNSINWDSAYNWGNHAVAGYASSQHVHSGLQLHNHLQFGGF